MVNSTKLAATAKRLIEANGRTVTLYKRNRTAADANKPWRGPSDTPGDSFEAIVAFVPPGGSGFGRRKEVDGALVQAFDQVGLLAGNSAVGEVVEDYATLVDGADSWKIVSVERLQPGGTLFLYALGLKR